MLNLRGCFVLKASLVLSLFLVTAILPGAGSADWVWVNGSDLPDQTGVYDSEGDFHPAGRAGAMGWSDDQGNFWMFGGETKGNDIARYWCDLWKFRSDTGNWTWMKGPQTYNEPGVYNTLGVEAQSSNPGARVDGATWVDDEGNLWLFGGSGYGVDYAGPLNDLWKYSPLTNRWTWMKGSQERAQPGRYGEQGESDARNNPPARTDCVTWVDPEGKLWLFGGTGYYSGSGGYVRYNDLWRYDPETNIWTWVKGHSASNQAGIYGTMGVAASDNAPGARNRAAGWVDADGCLWLFGGIGYGAASGSEGFLNDLWKYDPVTNEWTWIKGSSLLDRSGVYGVQGKASPNNAPAGTYSCLSWVDSSGHFWLFGGMAYSGATTMETQLLWRYDPDSNLWTWMKGQQLSGSAEGVYGTRGVESVANTPGSRYKAVAWKGMDGSFWVSGGMGFPERVTTVHFDRGFLDDVWRFNPGTNCWTWIKGSKTRNRDNVNYGPQGIDVLTNRPGGRDEAMTWSGPNGRLWMFGGQGSGDAESVGQLNDLWEYLPNRNSWVFRKGTSKINRVGVYGERGVTAITNLPGSRRAGATWVGADESLWLFGGYGRGASGSASLLNDLWKYDRQLNAWTWVWGSSNTNQSGNYGNSPRPGARSQSATWTDAQGNLWLFGGAGLAQNNLSGSLGDLWKYEPANDNWVFVKGHTLLDRSGRYGARGVAASTNAPGGRAGAITWSDSDGMMWMFGGYGFDSVGTRGSLNDLWMYDPGTNNWTWVKGSNRAYRSGIYGTRGVAHADNTPGGRFGSARWVDSAGNLWLLGGNGHDMAGTLAQLNDLWRFDPGLSQWTWMKGGSEVRQLGEYGELGVLSSENTPGARQNPASWMASDGVLWMFGGYGYGSSGSSGVLNELWKLEIDPGSGVDAWNQY